MRVNFYHAKSQRANKFGDPWLLGPKLDGNKIFACGFVKHTADGKHMAD